MDVPQIEPLLGKLDHSLSITDGEVLVSNRTRLREKIHHLAEASSLGSGTVQGMARYLTRKAAFALGIHPASIHNFYMARGEGTIPATFTVPAMNLRALSFHAARAVFRAARSMDAGALIFEIARSEIGYTDQRPAEYATNILAAAIAEGYQGPVCIQGDHFQVSPKRYAIEPEDELRAVRDLTAEAIAAGFFNIDVDTSTLVDLSQDTIAAQQALNTRLSSELTAFIRSVEPQDVTVSVGGEIGEVGGQNSTEPELRAYMDGYLKDLDRLAPGVSGLSKISIQTGTSHGGVVLPDGSIADVSVDFDTLRRLSQVARLEYGLAGAVQHGASTLPEMAFGKFVEAEACEVHLATNFQNMLYDRLPADLRAEIYAYLEKNHGDERKPGMTDEQFHYKTRKRAIGPFKAELWGMEAGVIETISQAWEDQFRKLFRLLGLEGTRHYIEEQLPAVAVEPQLQDYLAKSALSEDVRDLAD
jgi:fructose/tagatose bisphosphate aldolase